MKEGALAITGILLLVIAVSGCVSQGQPGVVETRFTEGVKYTYDLAYADSNETAQVELYITDEEPRFWEGIVAMKGELTGGNESHKVAHMSRFRINKGNFWVGMTGRLSLQEAVKRNHLTDSFLDNDISIPFFLHSFIRENSLNFTRLRREGEAYFRANSWNYVMTMEGPLKVGGFLGYRLETKDFPTKYTFYVSAGEPYLLLGMDRGDLKVSLSSIRKQAFNASEWEDYVLFLRETTFNRSQCPDYLTEEEAEELLGANVSVLSSVEGDLELHPVANLVCLYDSRDEHIAVVLERFRDGNSTLEWYGNFLEVLGNSTLEWDETDEFGALSTAYTGGVTHDIKFVSENNPEFLVTVASQREEVAEAAAGKAEAGIRE